jgi:hypothetical protein
MAQIFISHSCKMATPGEDPRLTFARDVRDRIYDGLEELGHEPLLDKKSLEPGQDWRARLHRWLADCDGAVILFDSLSVTSEWLRKEATVLSWRRTLSSGLVLVPVFLDGFRTEDLKEAGFGSLDVDRWQVLRLESGGTTDADAEKLASLTVAAFKHLTARAGTGPMQRWVEDVASLLADASPVHQERARQVLDVDDEDWREFPDRQVTLAHQLLHTGIETAAEALRELKPGMLREPFERLVDQLLPTWVETAAAAHLSTLVTAARRPIVVINAEDQAVGKDYVSRAHFKLMETGRFIAATDPVGEGGVDELLPRYEMAFIARAGQRPDRPNPLLKKPELLGTFLQNPPKFVLLGAGAAQPELLRRLQSKYGEAAFILLSGCRASGVESLANAALIEPQLTEGRLDEIDLMRLEMSNLAA